MLAPHVSDTLTCGSQVSKINLLACWPIYISNELSATLSASTVKYIAVIWTIYRSIERDFSWVFGPQVNAHSLFLSSPLDRFVDLSQKHAHLFVYISAVLSKD